MLYNKTSLLLTTAMERENPYKINLEELLRQQNVIDMRTPESESGIIVRAGLDIMGIGNIVKLMDEAPNAFLASSKDPDQTTTELIDSLYDSHKDGVYHVWGYRINGREVSYIIGLAEERNSDTISIGPMYVSEEFRGRGLGFQQLRDFIEYYSGPAQMYSTVRTKTWSQNEESRSLFEGLGFKQVDVIENDRANGDSTIIYELETANWRPNSFE